MQVRSLIFSAVAFIVLCLCGAAQAAQMAQVDRQQVVARVGVDSVILDQVLEQWGPTWYEIMSRAQREKLSGAQVNSLLQKAWEKSLDIVIRDETFYQEAVRSYDKMIRKIVDAQVATQGPGSRSRVERDIKRRIDKVRTEQVNSIIERSIKSAGGFENLSNVLKNRGITFELWKNRIIRKAHTYTFLYALFEPMGNVLQPSPREVLAYYKKNRKDFLIPGKVVFRHIFLSSKVRGGDEKAYDAATEVYTAIADGKLTFEQAARKYSDDKQSAASGGLERDISADPEREAWLSEVREAARDQKPGELGPVLISPRGCHLAELIRIGKPSLIPYAKAQKTILGKMRAQKWERQSEELYKKLKGVVHVDITLPQFPREYSWENSRKAQGTRRIGFGADPGVSK